MLSLPMRMFSCSQLGILNSTTSTYSYNVSQQSLSVLRFDAPLRCRHCLSSHHCHHHCVITLPYILQLLDFQRDGDQYIISLYNNTALSGRQVRGESSKNPLRNTLSNCGLTFRANSEDRDISSVVRDWEWKRFRMRQLWRVYPVCSDHYKYFRTNLTKGIK